MTNMCIIFHSFPVIPRNVFDVAVKFCTYVLATCACPVSFSIQFLDRPASVARDHEACRRLHFSLSRLWQCMCMHYKFITLALQISRFPSQGPCPSPRTHVGRTMSAATPPHTQFSAGYPTPDSISDATLPAHTANNRNS